MIVVTKVIMIALLAVLEICRAQVFQILLPSFYPSSPPSVHFVLLGVDLWVIFFNHGHFEKILVNVVKLSYRYICRILYFFICINDKVFLILQKQS